MVDKGSVTLQESGTPYVRDHMVECALAIDNKSKISRNLSRLYKNVWRFITVIYLVRKSTINNTKHEVNLRRHSVEKLKRLAIDNKTIRKPSCHATLNQCLSFLCCSLLPSVVTLLSSTLTICSWLLAAAKVSLLS